VPGFGMLQDSFADNVRDPVLWSGSYGDVAEVAGRARVPCTTDYSGYASASIYSLAGAQVACRVYAPAAGGAVAEALAEVLVLTSTGGTDAGFSLNAATGQLRLVSRVGYADPGEVALTYSPTEHAWVRLLEGDGSLSWDTSPDGRLWTTQRTTASPAWTADPNLGVVLAGHRDSGTGDYSEFDNFNIVRPGSCAPLQRSLAGPGPYPRGTSTVKGA
jgi:hypothetical protein